MAVELAKEPDYNVLLETLIDKTKAGKLRWQETANESVFIAAVKGLRTFEIACDEVLRSAPFSGVFGPPGPEYPAKQYTLKVQDAQGKPLFDTPPEERGPAEELFRLAKRVASGVDEKLDATVEMLADL